MPQQPALGWQTAGISRECAIRAYHTMTRHKDRQRIGTYRTRNSTHRTRTAHGVRHRTISCCRAIWNSRQRLPHLTLECRTRRTLRHVEYTARASKILIELRHKPCEHHVVACALMPVVAVVPPHPAHGTALCYKPQATARCRICRVLLAHTLSLASTASSHSDISCSSCRVLRYMPECPPAQSKLGIASCSVAVGIINSLSSGMMT